MASENTTAVKAGLQANNSRGKVEGTTNRAISSRTLPSRLCCRTGLRPQQSGLLLRHRIAIVSQPVLRHLRTKHRDDDHQARRPFMLSAPRLVGPDEVQVQILFASAGLDGLFRMKRGPQLLAAVRESLDLQGADDLFPSLFTTRPPRTYEAYRGDGVRWRYFGYACILIETSGVSILIDSVLSYIRTSQKCRVMCA